MPVWNWNQIHETGNLNYLYIDEKNHQFEAFQVSLEEIWLEILQQYFDKYGFPQTLIRKFKIKKKLIALRCRLVLTGDRSLANDITLLEMDLELLNKKNKSTGKDFNVYMWQLRIQTKLEGLDPKKMSVVQYKALIEAINENAKQLQNG